MQGGVGSVCAGWGGECMCRLGWGVHVWGGVGSACVAWGGECMCGVGWEVHVWGGVGSACVGWVGSACGMCGLGWGEHEVVSQPQECHVYMHCVVLDAMN